MRRSWCRPTSQVQAPVRSLDQRMEALKRANDIRVKRAQLKKDLKSADVSIEQILRDPPEYVSTAKVFDMLMAVPKFGRVKAAAAAEPVPDQPVEDRRRPVRPPAPRADWPLQPVAAPVFVLTGPSGAGKGTMVQALLARIPQLRLAVSATTRPRRPRESDGVDYWFISDEEFDRRLAEGDFLEFHVFPWGQRSGTLRSELERIAAGGGVPLLELELNGSIAVKRAMPEAVTIFVDAPIDELERRLRDPGNRELGRDRGPDPPRGRAAAARRPVRPHRRERRPRAGRGRVRADRQRDARRPQVRWRADDSPTHRPAARQGGLALLARDRRGEARAADQQLPPPARRGHLRRVPPPLIRSRSKNYLTMSLEEIAEGKISYDYRR